MDQLSFSLDKVVINPELLRPALSRRRVNLRYGSTLSDPGYGSIWRSDTIIPPGPKLDAATG